MVTKRLTLFFPKSESEKPIVYHLVKDHNLVVNIFRAKVTPEEFGYLVLDVSGDEAGRRAGHGVRALVQRGCTRFRRRRVVERRTLHALRRLPSALPDRGAALRRPVHAAGGVRFVRMRRVPRLPRDLPVRGVHVAVLMTDGARRRRTAQPRTWTVFQFKEATSGWPRGGPTSSRRRSGVCARSWRRTSSGNRRSRPRSCPSTCSRARRPIAVAMAEAARACGWDPWPPWRVRSRRRPAEAALAAGAGEAIVENGGDTWIASRAGITVGLYAGEHPLSGRLALRIEPDRLPLSVCSSSGRFGHSLSFGDCDLATVVARSGALADAAATLAANCVRTVDDVEPTLERVAAIPGILGVLIVKDDRVGVAGDLPPLVKCEDPDFVLKTRHR